jgi:protoporphyrinogen oxidase
MKVIILGAGPAGLALAEKISSESNHQIILIDAGAQVGGLAQTLSWGNFGSHDLGPHKLFTINKNLEKKVHSLLPEQGWLTQIKKSRIFMNGYFLPYPPSPFSLVHVFGPIPFLKMGFSYGFSLLKSILIHTRKLTFEQDLTSRIGKELYQALFRPIALKLWGDPKTLDSKLST